MTGIDRVRRKIQGLGEGEGWSKKTRRFRVRNKDRDRVRTKEKDRVRIRVRDKFRIRMRI